MIRSWLIGGGVALLSACAAPPVQDSPVPELEVPLAWSAQPGGGVAGSTSLVDWWLRFGDPTMSDLVAQAMQANTTVALARTALLQARAARDLGAAAMAPQLTGAATAQRARSAGNTHNSFSVGLDASWELDLFGGTRSAVDALDAGVDAGQASLSDARVSVAAEVALSYITLRSTQERLAIAASNLASQQETLQITLWREQAGLVSGLESEQARTAVAQTRAQLPALQSGIDQAGYALAVLTGHPPLSLVALLQVVREVPQPPQDLALALPAETLRQRSDLRAAEYRIAAALSRVAQARTARLPRFRLGGSLGLNALTLGSLTSGASLAAALLGSVSLPIFDGGASLAQVHAQQAALEQARVSYQAAVLVALKEVEDALAALRGDRERLLSLRAAEQAASAAGDLARQRYSSGLVDFQTVLETQRAELSTQDSVAAALASVSADHVRLYKALGGGWLPGNSATAEEKARNASGIAPP